MLLQLFFKRNLYLFVLLCSFYSFAQFPRFKALVFYSTEVEEAHVNFANDAIAYLKDLTIGDGFILETTTNMDDLLLDDLQSYSLIIMLNDFPHTQQQRAAFEKYMDNGGGWLGFHVSAYNDKTANWPWFVDFLGGAVFYTNNWPPMPAKIIVEDTMHPVTKGMPKTYIAPANEWYQWKPSPRENPDVKVLASLSEDNYPFGLKDIIQGGDTPVVWTHTKYRMVYMNIGHGSRIFKEAVQNRMVIAALKYVVSTDKKGNVFKY
ncbi:ThuA domain-containing protein [Galbibacter sp. PAP.153]|uniref:ThuA domain-containing protein n=1 Tax=Galbibacter sp. PAP.153 TaxID=3104623 RepID=UPI003008F5CA